MKCLFCGSEIPAGYGFCSVCGNAVNGNGYSGGAKPVNYSGSYNMPQQGGYPNGQPSVNPGAQQGGYQGSYQQNMNYPANAYPQNGYNQGVTYNTSVPEPGRGTAIASLVLGIISLVCIFFGTYAFLGSICGIVGLILSIVSKNQGFKGGIRTAGFVLNLIGVIITVLVTIACVACFAALMEAGGEYLDF